MSWYRGVLGCHSLPILFVFALYAATIILVILFRLAFKRLARLRSKDQHRMSIVVKWGRQRILLPLPPPDTRLQTLRRSLAEYTQLPEHAFKLIHSGAVMKGDAPISAYNIRENSVIVLIGGGVDLSTNPKTNITDRTTEQSVITQIRSELDQVRNTLSPSVDVFLRTLLPTPSQPQTEESSATTHPDQLSLGKEHMRLAELLLQSLLRLDAIVADGEWEEARAERKSAVKEVQGLLDRLDSGWTTRPGLE